MDSIRDAALRAFAKARGLAPEVLDLDDAVDDEEDEAVVRALCERAGIEIAAVFPVARHPARSELAVGGLRRLAPFSPAAAVRLDELRLRWEVPTIGSVIRSLEERRPAGSGRWDETPDPPIPPGHAAAVFALGTLGTGLLLTVALWTGCDPACRACPTLAETLPRGLGLPLLAVAAWHVAMLMAALRALRAPYVAQAPL